MRRFAVIGLGRFGTKLAVQLAKSGAEVIAIDKDRLLIEELRDQVSLAVRLDSTDMDAMMAQGVNKVDVAIVGIGQGKGGFEAAILSIVNLKEMGIKEIFSRAETQIASKVFKAVGATEVIFPEVESADRWAYKLIAPQVADKMDFAPGYSLARVTASASFHEKTVKDLQLRQKYNVNLVAIKRSETGSDKGAIINVPMPNTVIYENDIMMLAGSDTDLASLPQI